MHQVGQVLFGEFPLEGLSDLIIVFLKVENPFGQVSEGKEVIGCEHFSLEDGKGNIRMRKYHYNTSSYL